MGNEHDKLNDALRAAEHVARERFTGFTASVDLTHDLSGCAYPYSGTLSFRAFDGQWSLVVSSTDKGNCLATDAHWRLRVSACRSMFMLFDLLESERASAHETIIGAAKGLASWLEDYRQRT